MPPAKKTDGSAPPPSASPEPSSSSAPAPSSSSTNANLKRKASKAALSSQHANKKSHSAGPSTGAGADTEQDEESMIRELQAGGMTRHQIAALRTMLRQQREAAAAGTTDQAPSAPPGKRERGAHSHSRSPAPAPAALRAQHEREREVEGSPVPARPAVQGAEGDATDGDDGEEQKRFCLCRCTEEDAQENMIACEGGCDEWYHAACVSLTLDELLSIDTYICARCEAHTSARTTYKPPCANPACKNFARLPLSRYCSEQCGVLAIVARLHKVRKPADRAYAQKMLVPAVRLAQKRESRVIWGQGDEERRGWFALWPEGEGDGDEGAGAGAGASAQDDPDADTETDPDLLIDVPSLLATHAPSRPTEVEALLAAQRALKALLERKKLASRTLDLAMARTTLLHLAEDRAGSLPPVRPAGIGGGAAAATGEESGAGAAAPQKKSKKSAGASRAKVEEAQPRCGYDDRLSWGDEAFARWAGSRVGGEVLSGGRELDGWDDEAEPQGEAEGGRTSPGEGAGEKSALVCPMARKKCKRHADWVALRGEDFAAEKGEQEKLLEAISRREPLLRARIAELRRNLQEIHAG